MAKVYCHPKALVEKGSEIGPGTRVWAFAHILKGAQIGRDCNIGDHVYIEAGARVGDRVTIKNGVSIWDAVTIEDDCFIGPNVAFTNDLWPASRKHTPFISTFIRKGASVGANATLVCGKQIGYYAFVGAGAVVTHDIPDYALVVGNPGRIKDFVCVCRKKLSFKLARSRCACGRSYRKVKGRVTASDD